MPSLLCKAASESQGEEGQKCLIALRVLEAVCCVLSHMWKLVDDRILGRLGPKICWVQQAPAESKDCTRG